MQGLDSSCGILVVEVYDPIGAGGSLTSLYKITAIKSKLTVYVSNTVLAAMLVPVKYVTLISC
jgi:hypothetical protein